MPFSNTRSTFCVAPADTRDRISPLIYPGRGVWSFLEKTNLLDPRDPLAPKDSRLSNAAEIAIGPSTSAY